ncbi:unnamed protein product [Sphagnum balticum]
MGRSYMLLISSPCMSLVVALLLMFVSKVLSQTELTPAPASTVSCLDEIIGTSPPAEENAVKALYTGWGILSAMGAKECSDPCICGWEGVICVQLVQPAVASGSCNIAYMELIGLGLRGHLSGAIGNLTNLQLLTITGNPGLTGNLPSEIGSLTNLTMQLLKKLCQSALWTLRDIHDNNFTGVIPNLARLANLNILFLNGNAFSGSIEHVFQGLNTFSYKRVDLSSNQLTGSIPGLTTGLGNFSQLNLLSLNVSHNHIGGYFNISNQFSRFLGTLDLSYNNISGDISTLILCNFSIGYNLFETVHYPSYDSHELRKKLAWILSTILPSFVILNGIIFFIMYRMYHKNMLALHEIQQEFAKQEVQPILYSYKVLKVATNDFHPSNKLGEGGCGAVYKGILLDGTNVAVKLLNKSHQQVSEFLNEIVLMTGVKHKNLVKVKGCSLQGTQRLIVFEFVENKNLAEALWDRHIKNVLFLDWTMRFNICVGIAHGLIYLHEYLQPRIIHRDIKASNILLDKDLNPKIADFGLARLFPEDISHLSTAHIAGTMGYLSPEYATLGKLTEKVDVFSYGVLLLEIVSGRKNIDLSLETNKIYLLEWLFYLHVKQMRIGHNLAKFAKQQVQPILYSYSVLKVATKYFHPSNKLGEGGFGAIYKGILPDGTNVAVKLLNKSHQGVSEFLNEIVLMTGVSHKNLVKVKGCSLRATQRLIVFEYVENKNLAEALWGQQIKNVLFLNWTMRFNICVGIAHGLIHLHEYLQPHIIHRDIKGANILLDKDLNPKIADFGLARLFPEDISHLSTAHIAGTMGYLSPEYATLGQLSEKVDVFSYGVLLLEIVSGRKNIDLSLETNKIYLLEWACSLHEQDKLMDLIDQRLNNNVLDDEAHRVINVALLCVQTSATRRPSMSRVLAMLLNEVDVEVVSKKTNPIHEMDISHLLGSNNSLSPSGLI